MEFIFFCLGMMCVTLACIIIVTHVQHQWWYNVHILIISHVLSCSLSSIDNCSIELVSYDLGEKPFHCNQRNKSFKTFKIRAIHVKTFSTNAINATIWHVTYKKEILHSLLCIWLGWHQKIEENLYSTN